MARLHKIDDILKIMTGTECVWVSSSVTVVIFFDVPMSSKHMITCTLHDIPIKVIEIEVTCQKYDISSFQKHKLSSITYILIAGLKLMVGGRR